MSTRVVGSTRMAMAVLVVAGSVIAGAYFELRPAKPDVRIMTGRVTRGEVSSLVTTTGTIGSVDTVDIGSEVDGLVSALNADFNSVVHKGDILARLDPTLLRAQITEARADLARLQSQADQVRVNFDEAQRELGRSQTLADRQVITPSDLEDARVAEELAAAQLKDAEAQVRQAQATLDQSNVQMGYTEIRSPADGIILARKVDVGQTITAKLSAPTLFVLGTDLTTLRVLVNVDESDIGRVHEGDPATLVVDAFPSDQFTGTVSQLRIQPVIDQGVVSYNAILDVRNPELKLRPGMTAIVTINCATHNDVLRVPQSAIHFVPGADVFKSTHQPVPAMAAPASSTASAAASKSGRIWIYENGKLRSVNVTVGLADGPFAEVRSAELQPGMVVATGATVTVHR